MREEEGESQFSKSAKEVKVVTYDIPWREPKPSRGTRDEPETN